MYRDNANRLFLMVERLQKLLMSELGSESYENTLKAANVYRKILVAINKARETANVALNLGMTAYEKVNRKD